MADKEWANRNGSALIEENEHQRAGAGVSRLRAAKSMTALTCSRSRPSNHCRMSSILAPASRFSKIVETGIRVPRNTHAPLTLPGIRSTAEHCDQSRTAMSPSSGCSYSSVDRIHSQPQTFRPSVLAVMTLVMKWVRQRLHAIRHLPNHHRGAGVDDAGVGTDTRRADPFP